MGHDWTWKQNKTNWLSFKQIEHDRTVKARLPLPKQPAVACQQHRLEFYPDNMDTHQKISNANGQQHETKGLKNKLTTFNYFHLPFIAVFLNTYHHLPLIDPDSTCFVRLKSIWRHLTTTSRLFWRCAFQIRPLLSTSEKFWHTVRWHETRLETTGQTMSEIIEHSQLTRDTWRFAQHITKNARRCEKAFFAADLPSAAGSAFQEQASMTQRPKSIQERTSEIAALKSSESTWFKMT